MSLRDTFRSLRKGGDDDGETPEEAPEPGDFRPRTDGSYDGGDDPDHPGARIYLRFAGNRVREVVGTGDAAAARAALVDPSLATAVMVGDFTQSGRFSVQATFERPITYALLAADDDGYTVRRTNSGTATTHRVTLVFVPDQSP